MLRQAKELFVRLHCNQRSRGAQARCLAVMAQAQSSSQELHNASLAIVDEDHSELSRRIATAFLAPYFRPAEHIAEQDVDRLMNTGRCTFVIDIPPRFA